MKALASTKLLLVAVGFNSSLDGRLDLVGCGSLEEIPDECEAFFVG
jgi:hypothetical protein